MRDLMRLAETLGLRIIEAHGHHAAGYRADDHTIRLRPGLTERDGRSLLAHELGHHVLGHRPQPPSLLRDRQERSANEWAAAHLIPLGAFRAAEAAHDGHTDAMGHTLGVHHKLVEVYQDMLERIGDTVYLRPRMGLGQWDYREEVA